MQHMLGLHTLELPETIIRAKHQRNGERPGLLMEP